MANWIAGAITRPGALTHKAKAAGVPTGTFAATHAADKGLTGRQSRLAQTLAKFRRQGRFRKRPGRPLRGRLAKAGK